MPLLQRSDSIAANGFNANIWSGTQFEFAPYQAALRAGVLSSATGLNLTFATGSDTLMIDQVLSVVRAANQFPLFPDDFVITDAVAAGERIVEAIRNTTAGALTAFSSLLIDPF